MNEPITLNKLEQYLEFFHKMYDAVRIVNPIAKEVLEYQDKHFSSTHEVCHKYWGETGICDNCISIRAHHDDKSYVKLEQTPEAIIMVTAFPVKTSETEVVLELFKNATDSILVGTGVYEDGQPMQKIVQDMNDMICKDALTTLYNRHYINDRLPADIVKATLTQTPITIIFFDMDDLKFINDTYGHSAGDLILKQTAKTVLDYIQEGDWVSRYGGDEFLICLNNRDSQEAYQVALKIQTAISAISVPFQDKQISSTVSIGIHTMEDAALTAEELILLADKNMYEAKKNGKNLIVTSR